jgi:hypothetical protein
MLAAITNISSIDRSQTNHATVDTLKHFNQPQEIDMKVKSNLRAGRQAEQRGHDDAQPHA